MKLFVVHVAVLLMFMYPVDGSPFVAWENCFVKSASQVLENWQMNHLAQLVANHMKICFAENDPKKVDDCLHEDEIQFIIESKDKYETETAMATYDLGFKIVSSCYDKDEKISCAEKVIKEQGHELKVETAIINAVNTHCSNIDDNNSNGSSEEKKDTRMLLERLLQKFRRVPETRYKHAKRRFVRK